MACPPQHPNGSIAQRSHDMRDIATAHLGAVFIERHIAHPMRLVLNLPLPAYKLQQTCGGCPLGAETGDSIDHFHPFFPRFLVNAVTPQLKDLCETRPIAIAHQSLTCREIALLDAPMADVHRTRGLLTVACRR